VRGHFKKETKQCQSCTHGVVLIAGDRGRRRRRAPLNWICTGTFDTIRHCM